MKNRDYQQVKEYEKPTKMTIMWKDIPQVEILMTMPRPTVRKLVEEPSLNIIGRVYREGATYKDLDEFMLTRVSDRTRVDINEILKRYDLKDFNPYWMCRKSHGRKVTDFLWIRYNDEDLTYDDIKIW